MKGMLFQAAVAVIILSGCGEPPGSARGPSSSTENAKAEGFRNAGAALLEKEQWEDAIDAFSKAIEADPENAVAYVGRAEALSRLLRFDAAIADCTRAIELDPDNHRAYSTRGTSYVSRNMLKTRNGGAGVPGDREKGHADIVRGAELKSKQEATKTDSR